MQEKLQLRLQEKQYRDMLVRYHFGEHDLEQLRQIGNLVEEAMEPVMHYEVFTRKADERVAGDDISSIDCMAVIVTLGSGVDELQNRYTQRESLTKSYMTECIGMELLRAAYEQAAESIHVYTGRWMSGFEFVGDKIPFTYMEEIFRLLEPQGVSYNQAYMLTPKKTVVFLANLCDERKYSYCHVCAECSCLACPSRKKIDGEDASESRGYKMERSGDEDHIKSSNNVHRETERSRNLTYGYQKIFGTRE